MLSFDPNMNSGQRLRQVGLPHARGPEEHEDADRALRVLQPRARSPHGLRDRADRLALADHALVEELLHLEQPRRLLGGDPRQRDARPHGDDVADVLVAHHQLVAGALRLHLLLELLELRLQAHLALAQLGGVLVLLVADRLVLLAP